MNECLVNIEEFFTKYDCGKQSLKWNSKPPDCGAATEISDKISIFPVHAHYIVEFMLWKLMKISFWIRNYIQGNSIVLESAIALPV